MATKKLIKELEIEKQGLINQIEDLRASISELTEREAELRGRVGNVHAAPEVERRKVIIEELLIDVDEGPEAKAFDDYFAQDDPFVSKIRQSLMEE